ncbi:MAG: hypothetical protein Q7S09_02655 [bacterium]|nr:hypothetical protein [bacterium]
MDAKERKYRIVLFEILGGFAWLYMDVSWMMHWIFATTLFGAISIIFNALSLYYARSTAQFAAVGGTMAWVLMCASWLLYDTYEIAWFKLTGVALFVICNACIFSALMQTRFAKERTLSALEYFKRLRIHVP